MSQYQNILLITDPDREDSPAQVRAVRLAQATGALLHIAVFEHLPALDLIGRFSPELAALVREAQLQQRAALMADMRSRIEASGVDVEGEVIWGGPVDEKLLDHCLRLAPDIVIKDVAIAPRLSRLLLTPLDWKLLRTCPYPLMLVNAGAAPLPRRLIAAVDPADAAHRAGGVNERIVRQALALAIQADAPVELAQVFAGLPAAVLTTAAESGVWLPELYGELRAQSRKTLADFAQAQGVPWDRCHLLDGDAAEALTAFAADAGADMIVLGTLTHGFFHHLLIGSTAERILQYAGCDILAVKPEGFLQRIAQQRSEAQRTAQRPPAARSRRRPEMA